MRVNAHSEISGVVGSTPARKPQQSEPVRDQAIFSEVEKLQRSLAQVPEVRADKVALAKALIADKNYPSPEATQELADLLARRIKSNHA
jgi:hypothetical protein